MIRRLMRLLFGSKRRLEVLAEHEPDAAALADRLKREAGR